VPSYKSSTNFVKIKKIVIDPGHGGNDPGAIGRTGLREDFVNLDLAKRVSSLLRRSGVEVVMTRSSDRLIPLSTRAEVANNSRADLFVSIHTNANHSRSLKGFEVYYVAPSVSDSKRASTSAREESPRLDNAYFASSSLNLKSIIWDMVYTNSRAESIELAKSICRSVDKNMGVCILGVKGARFAVLKGVQMPGILIEVGFLSNPDEERKLKISSYREQLAVSIVEGIRNYDHDVLIMEASRE